ncbi:hypothetical protein [Oceanisphaera avium]|uniref:Uncharacterized protein n=1 Tax=Oceanisphaera avium TaxID=1903694 RepID=A0A1Y0CWN9_9GAMM|nr:hypothetical protein [Oceanisphaera avium]ART79316.1 hypothetical protein CBP12_03435 [Oceanisphaera avium]
MRERLTGPKLGQIFVVLLILAGAFFYKTYKNEEKAPEKGNSINQLCDIAHTECEQVVEDLTATAWISSTDLAPETPFTLNIRFSEPDVKLLKSRLEGHSMYMGTLPALLEEQTPNHWKGQVLVGACTEREMMWAWKLDVEHRGEIQQLTFLFEVTR